MCLPKCNLRRYVEVSFDAPSVQVLSILAAATAPFLWRHLSVFTLPPPGVTGVFVPTEFERIRMTLAQMTRAKKDAVLDAMMHRRLPQLPSIERDVLYACLACTYLTAAHELTVAAGRKRDVFIFVALLPGFRRAVATENTRRTRRRRALGTCAFLGNQRRAEDAKAETWEDVEFKPPTQAPKTAQEVQAVGLCTLTPPDPQLKGAWLQPLYLSSDEPVSKCAFQMQLAPL
jgi:hypothetical protein